MRSDSCSNQQHHLSRKPHEQRVKLLTKHRDRISVGVQIRAIVMGSVLGTLLNSLVLLPKTLAQTVPLAVVKSPENQRQWSGITRRLQSTGVAYCIVDFAQVQQASDLGSTKLLFLPNIEQLQPIQLAALQEWMRQGGRVIVSGPMGTMSDPEVRTKLRSLLGAYWGFALTKPTSLEPLKNTSQTWVPAAGLRSTLLGGVVIPASLNSTTAAVWSQNDNPPAVVTTDQSTFLGWRWGMEGVAPVEVDSAWLQAVLSRYDVTSTGARTSSNEPPPTCGSSQVSTANQPTTPPPNPQQNNLPRSLPTPGNNNRVVWRFANGQPEREDVVPPAQGIPEKTGSLTAKEFTVMDQELQNLIGRFQSALLAANAINSNVNLQTGAAIEQYLVASTKSTSGSDNTQTPAQLVATDSANRVLAEARKELQNFRDATSRANYDEARQHWIQARRTLWDHYPLDRKLAQPEIRAIWLDRGTIVRAKSDQDLAKLFDQLAAAGFNTVFFETVNASYPIYPSAVAPEQNPLVRGWDPLAAAVKLAHERGMELHAWVWMFAAANQRHNLILNQPINYLGPVLSAHPDWAMFDRQGRLFELDAKKAFLDPANPEVRRYLMRLLDEIATRYNVDGIQLDYIRYPFQDTSGNQTFGYGKVAREQFKALTSVDPIEVYPNNRELWQKWTDFRIRQIDSFVATVSQRLRLQRPNLILSAAVFPLPRQERLQRLQQNWEDWAIQGDVDLMVPMTYAIDTTGLQNLAQPFLTESTLSSALILPAIRLLNLPNIVAVDQIQLLRDLPTSGYALFAVENLDANLGNIFSRTQGTRDSFSLSSQSSVSNPQSPIPYRQPFSAAAARYTALQREWSFLLANHQILIQEPALSEWGKQADALSIALNQLAKEPSMQNLSSAKGLLLAFRSQFKRWMGRQSVEQPYQVQVWDNRLATIERLLRYGERTALNRHLSKVTVQP